MSFESFNHAGVRGQIDSRIAGRVRDWIDGRLETESIREFKNRSIVALPDSGGRIFLKSFLNDTGWQRWFVRRGHRRAGVEFRNLVAARGRGIPVPEPLGCIRDAGRGMVLMREFGPAREVIVALKETKDREGRRKLIRALGRLLDLLGGHGVEHGDLHGGNILAKEGELCLLDLQSATVRAGALPVAGRVKLASALASSLERWLRVSETGTLLKAAGLGRAHWEEICERIRDHHHRFRTSRAEHAWKGGSGYRRARIGPWQVVARAGLPDDRLEEGFVKRTLGKLIEIKPRDAERVWKLSVGVHFSGVPSYAFPAIGIRPDGAALLQITKSEPITLKECLGTAEDREMMLLRLGRFSKWTHDHGVSGLKELLVWTNPRGRHLFFLADPRLCRLQPRLSDEERWRDLKALLDRCSDFISAEDRTLVEDAYVGATQRWWKARARIFGRVR